MKKAYTLFLFIVLVCTVSVTHAQSSLYIDSIQQLLRLPKPDTSRLHLFIKLTQLPDCSPDTLFRYEKLYYEYAEKHHLTTAIPYALYGIGVACFKNNNNSEAVNYFYRAAEMLEKSNNNPLQLSRCYEMLAMTYKNTDRNEDALRYYRQSYWLRLSLKNEQYLVSTYNGLGTTFRALGKPDSAIFYLKKSLLVAQNMHNTLNIAQVTNNLGNIYWQQDNYTEAISWYKKALESFEELENPHGIAEATFNLGSIAYNQNDIPGAIKYFNQSLAAVEDGQSLEHLEWTYIHLAYAYEKLHQYEKANINYKKHDLVHDSIFNIATQKAIDDVKEKYETEKKEQALKHEKERTLTLSKLNHRNRLVIYLLIFIAISITTLGFFLLSASRKKRMIADQLSALKHKENEQLIREQELKSNIAMLEGQEAERQRISMELHDRLGGTLASLKFLIQSVYVKDEQLSDHSQKIDLLLQDALKDVRGISHNMSVGILHKYGLAEALSDLRETIESSGTMQVVMNLQGVNRLPKQKAEEVYYIVRELTTNALKHSQASELYVQCLTEEEVLVLTVEDNGVGFDMSQRAKGIGLTNIEARAHKINATLDIESSPGNGTSFFFRIPIA
ncbi:Signal transduction histidine kinase [Filimonas lacunae]|uniref:Oxygen sensor histidine kinase NreB n=1 Tax=Filimonas lacunae TaxID=477680 RepID=A0A173MAT4_9BACT|nr:tetratricopeptide repeat protein [Filimonas lacunae]BAV04646.1 two-component sensor histidine kinase [Filimonas lacunae]SIT32516.1 Signal transduction histidine kinase [Filimonas lacunae]